MLPSVRNNKSFPLTANEGFVDAPNPWEEEETVTTLRDAKKKKKLLFSQAMPSERSAMGYNEFKE